MREQLAVIVVAVAVLASCGGDDGAAPPDRPPESTGPVSMVTGSAVRIDDGTGELTAVQARVDGATRILRRRGDGYEAVAIDAVRVGDRVELWVDGPVAESFPVQAHAEAVVLGG